MFSGYIPLALCALLGTAQCRSNKQSVDQSVLSNKGPAYLLVSIHDDVSTSRQADIASISIRIKTINETEDVARSEVASRKDKLEELLSSYLPKITVRKDESHITRGWSSSEISLLKASDREKMWQMEEDDFSYKDGIEDTETNMSNGSYVGTTKACARFDEFTKLQAFAQAVEADKDFSSASIEWSLSESARKHAKIELRRAALHKFQTAGVEYAAAYSYSTATLIELEEHYTDERADRSRGVCCGRDRYWPLDDTRLSEVLAEDYEVPLIKLVTDMSAKLGLE
ncbi:hypothetical protein LTR62_004701 [Meristemomyces frigidus]|uniref:Uncharacterized protein n=1 Tax=Meristemomyces frigidus TaxID=1508187 RepID=A0AAN7YFV9_9PEZI|nr:hypothetical protein LTR62_004701 [Meristemomyces frigidus]